MRQLNRIGAVAGIISALALGACSTANEPPGPSGAGVPNPDNAYAGYGVVQSVELVRGDANTGIGGSGIGVGTIAGAVVGGVVGNQVGSGKGNTAATVIGAAGGAYIGHELENRQHQKTNAHKITVRMENGSYQTLMQPTDAGFRVGDRVRVANGVLQRY